jgi:hypothetical protein
MKEERRCDECGVILKDDEQYMCKACIKFENMLDSYPDDDDTDWAERKEEELQERASNCTCGAWQIINGQAVHVADCCCGAE